MRLMFACPSCNVKSYSKYWNSATRERYGKYGGISEIQEEENNSFHLCPSCGVESEMFKGNLIIESTEPPSEAAAV